MLNLTRNFLDAGNGRHSGIRVNSLTPGFFPAEPKPAPPLQPRTAAPSARAQAIFNHTPMKRFGDPSELSVGAALLLAMARAGSFITGADICVDGGSARKQFRSVASVIQDLTWSFVRRLRCSFVTYSSNMLLIRVSRREKPKPPIISRSNFCTDPKFHGQSHFLRWAHTGQARSVWKTIRSVIRAACPGGLDYQERMGAD